jgi:hypothetical protein
VICLTIHVAVDQDHHIASLCARLHHRQWGGLDEAHKGWVILWLDPNEHQLPLQTIDREVQCGGKGFIILIIIKIALIIAAHVHRGGSLITIMWIASAIAASLRPSGIICCAAELCQDVSDLIAPG